MLTLNTLKETLRPCSSFKSSQPNSYSDSSISHHFEPSNLRKPPKSSLFKQIQRLEDPVCSSQIQSARDTANDEIGEEEKEEDRKRNLKPAESDKLKSALRQFDSTGPFEPLVLSLPGELPVIQVPSSINCRLLDHQKDGVKFLYKLYKNNHGGVLGDDMGLGKTIQTIAFLAAVYGKDKEEHAAQTGPSLIICPSSVIHNWETEISNWATFSVTIYHGANCELSIERLESRGTEILITSFDMFRINDSVLTEIQWEVVVVDEAHKLKNEKSKLYIAGLGIKTRRRFGLTGTVMQNKIMELFNVFDWVAPGCLGTREHFRDFYDEPLKHGQRSTAPERFIQIADERKRHLVAVLRKYMLRRTKQETIGHLMMGKEDNVVFCAMSELQKRAYRRILQLPDIQCLINKDAPCFCGSPLTQVECCRRTVPDGIIWPYLHKDNPDGCDSCPFCLVFPCIVKLQQISNHLELIKPNPRDDDDKQRRDAQFASAVLGEDTDMAGGSTQSESFMGLSDVKHCGKMRALEILMSSWTLQGDKILLFSYSVRMLDILEKLLIRRGYCFSRLDGSTPTNLRQPLVDEFNSSPSKQVFLISTRAGGLGLNLVSANRVVIFDPNWNPSQDLQAQDRSFRFGQKRHVIVFRLLAAGSLEELIYTRQVYKQQLSNIAVSGKLEKRYFEGVQDSKQFQGELFGICNLFRDLSDKLFTSNIIELHGKDKCDKEMPSCSAIFEDLGILYTHRNEDVINTKPSDVRKCGGGKENKLPRKDKMRLEFHRIADFMEMDEVKFSKWLLQASTTLEREKVLFDYKKQKMMAQNLL